jgi:hypothetical protein
MLMFTFSKVAATPVFTKVSFAALSTTQHEGRTRIIVAKA